MDLPRITSYNVCYTKLLRFSVENWISSQSVAPGQHLVGGYVQSIFHEFIDSALVRIQVDDQPVDSVYTEKGLFCFRNNFV